jgi:hypothetical protein
MIHDGTNACDCPEKGPDEWRDAKRDERGEEEVEGTPTHLAEGATRSGRNQW